MKTTPINARYQYEGVQAFGDDAGTLWISRGQPMSIYDGRGWRNARRLRKLVRKRLIVWIVDDERSHREWYLDQHGKHFAVITFSSRAHALVALQRGIPCDAVVTDIFFPAVVPEENDAAADLLKLYDDIEKSDGPKLRSLWQKVDEDNKWRLDGFKVATDVSRLRKQDVPVFLYSRKSAVLVSVEELALHASEPNVYWLPIKPRPSSDVSGTVVKGQRAKIENVVRERKQSKLIRRLMWILRLSGRSASVLA